MKSYTFCFTALVVLLVVAVPFAMSSDKGRNLTPNAVSSFPYTTTFASDNIGAGNWTATRSATTLPFWVNTATGGDGEANCVKMGPSANGAATSSLFITLNTSGVTFTGAEYFQFRYKVDVVTTLPKATLTVHESATNTQIGQPDMAAVTPATYNTVSYLLPTSVGNQASVTIEIRYTKIGNGAQNTVTVDNVTIDGGALPIQVASFMATTNMRNVNIEWSTISETNNLGFYVERKSGNGSYATVSSLIAGAGTTLEQHNYSYTDASVSAGTYNYRLRNVDLDGNVSYSHEIGVDVSSVLSVRQDGGVPVQFKLQQNYPNPFNPSTDIKFSIKDAGFTTLKIYNAAGQEVATLVNEMMQPNNYAVTWNASNMPSGAYFYRITSGSNVEVQRMLMIK